MANIGLKKKYFSLKIDNITVIKLKALAKQRGIKDYYKLGKVELIQKLEDHPDVNEQVLIPGLEIPRNTTRSVNTSANLDDPIPDDITPLLQKTRKFIDRSIQKIIVGTGQQLRKHENLTQVNVAGAQVAVSDSTRILGETIDKNLTLTTTLNLCAKTYTIIYEHYATSDRC